MKSPRRRRVKSLECFVTSVLLFFATEGLGVQIQEFRVRPEDVQVRAGDDVFLRCVVENQQGKAQWTKDGFALGFERAVPGYPRYQYTGDATLGEHHLIIRGVTLEDDGEYQCQVGPTTSSLPIWAAANVTVMVAPQSIAVVGRQDKEVVEVAAGSSLQLECLVSDARPAPSVAWYRDDLRVDPKLQRDTVKASRTPRLASILSLLVVQAVEAQDGEEYSCRALHPALSDETSYTSSSSSTSRSRGPLVASITLSVLHPPGPPVISGYRTGEVLQAGERRTLTCLVQGGNPRPWVTWYWHGRPLNHTSKGKARKSVYLKGKATIRKGKKTREVSLEQQVTASRAVDGAVYECRVSSGRLTRPLTTNVSLTVHYAPVQVKVSGPTVAMAGENFSLTCLTSPANPPASIIWSLDDSQVNATTTVVSKAEGGGWLTSSKLTLQAPRSSEVRAMTVKCQAYHLEHKEAISHTREVTIIRPPGPPVVEVTPRGQVMAGADLQVTCTSEGGHPPPQFRLYKGGKEMPSETTTQGNLTRARVDFRASPADNGAKVRCEVINPAATSPRAAHTTLHLLYPAWEVRGWVSPRSVEAGQVAKLTCETSSSVPPSIITWDASKDALGEPSVKHSPGLYGGTVTRSEVKVRLLAEDDGDLVICSADNGLGLVVNANVTLDVLHGPMWVKKPKKRIDVLEGEDLTVTATAVANPGPVRYRWRNGSQEMEEANSTIGELRLGPARRQQTGNYTVAAQNPRGTVAATFFLNVLYGPEDVLTETRVVVEEDGAATILCSAVGNPTPNITWTKKPDNTSNVTRVLSTGVGEARLTVEWASKADTGVYFCHASSRVSTATPTAATLVVKQSPWWTNKNPEDVVGGSWAAVGGIGRLECRMRAAPPPTFHWASQDGREITSGDKYSIDAPKLVDEVVEWSSMLEIRGVTPRDYSTYTCTALNTLGKHSYTLVLRPPMPPATPTDLTVTNVTSQEAMLLWTPNLSRTEPSGYVVRYWGNDDEYQYMNVSGRERTEAMVSGLSSGTPYTFTIQAYSPQGRSHHTSPVHATTLGISGSASSSSSSGGDGGAKSQVPRLILLIMTLAGTALLALNMAIIACFVRRRNSQANRGVSASSSKTTTLEVFTPATTPGGTTQGDELPLTTTTTDLTSHGGQRIECQIGVDDSEHTSLFQDIGREPAKSPECEYVSPPGSAAFRNRGRSQQNGRVLAQNGGATLQKYREDSSSYYYSPIPQNSGVPGDDGGPRRIANPPDVCPTTADDARGTLSRRHQHQQKAQQREDPSAPRPTEAPVGLSTQHLTSHPQQQQQQHSASKDSTSQPTDQRCYLPCDSRPEHQQQGQRRPSPRTTRGTERLSQLLQQQPQQSQQQQHLGPYSQSHYEAPTSTAGVWSGGYATVGPRKARPSSAVFSTLQRPETLRSLTALSEAGQEAPRPQGHHHQDLLSSYHLQQDPLRHHHQQEAAGAGQQNLASSDFVSSNRKETNGHCTPSRASGGSLVNLTAGVSSPGTSSNTLTRRRQSHDAARKGNSRSTPVDDVGE